MIVSVVCDAFSPLLITSVIPYIVPNQVALLSKRILVGIQEFLSCVAICDTEIAAVLLFIIHLQCATTCSLNSTLSICLCLPVSAGL